QNTLREVALTARDRRFGPISGPFFCLVRQNAGRRTSGMKFFQSILQRRSFVTRLSGGAAALAAAVGGAGILQSQSLSTGRWQPERERNDDWLDSVPGTHRFVFDSTTAEGC